MTRAERIAKAQAALKLIKPEYDEVKARYERVERELKSAEASFEPGDRVRVGVSDCYRGPSCCGYHYVGVVKAVLPKDKYVVVHEEKYHEVDLSDMERIERT